jgi:hypothetical protein
MRDIFTNVPTIKMGRVSEWSRVHDALGIIHSLGQYTPDEKAKLRKRAEQDLGVTISAPAHRFRTMNAIGGRMGANDMELFFNGLIGLSQVWAPVVGQMVGINQLMHADTPEKVNAIQTVLTGSAVGGRATSQQASMLNELQSQVMTLSWEERQRLVPSARDSLLARTSDPQIRAAIIAMANKLMAKTFWEKWTWPIVGLAVALPIGLGAFWAFGPRRFNSRF